MIRKIAVIMLSLMTISILAQKAAIHHEINAHVNPHESFISVIDEITISESAISAELTFKLHSELKVSTNENVILVNEGVTAEDVGMDLDDAASENKLKLNQYAVVLPEGHKGDFKFTLEYNGKIESPVEQSAENYARGFSESPGIISEIGVYLAGSTYWVAHFEGEMMSFNLTTTLPADWRTVTVGKRTIDEKKDGFHIDRWESPTPQEEVFLIAAAFHEYSYPMGAVTAYAFLRTPDEGIANKYLETTAQYMEMYRQLIGPYPYTKFALVENFWETGYGMPSFTLLGEKIIRFPFILHSSYPHELLHNWWGNSVYIDFEKGNWCEGLTAYMADHLIKEQRGQAEEYRRSTLQKYSDYVTSENDFPLNKFLSRHDAPSEAIGYGKTSMVNHMLRRMVGDEQFTRAYQLFNRKNKFRKASFDDIRLAFEEVTEMDLKWFFEQWIDRTGAPELSIEDVEVKPVKDYYNISFVIHQIQDGNPFVLDVPVALVDRNGTHIEIFRLNDKTGKFSINNDQKPVKILIDPQFDLMRRLDSREIPAAFSKAYGSEKTLIILPDKSNKNFQVYKDFADRWITGNEDKFTLKSQSLVAELPSDQAVWILGFDNTHASVINNSIKEFNSGMMQDSVKFEGTVLGKNNTSFFVAVKNPQNSDQAILFLSIGNKDAAPGLVGKLPHYGKYSYLAFEGDEPTNTAKGQWPVVNSPLMKVLDESALSIQPELETREALGRLAPVFNADRMLKSVEFLASDRLEGRGIGTQEIITAAAYIATKFQEAGLQPGSDDGSYYQIWLDQIKGKKLELKNVIGIIPGTNPDLADKPVIISAHYDHLGLGWPDVRKGNEGMIHNGADDNASGVAVMLEIAQILGSSFKPARTVIFVAFTAEESGLVGSRYFVNNYKMLPIEKTIANLNLDTVGRLFGNKLMVINGNTAREWKFIFMGTEYTTGVSTDVVSQDLDASDQMAFIEKGIPAVQFFSGPNEDYHKPSDDTDKIDADGMVKVATVARETLVYLADRPDPMPFTGEKKSETAAGKPESQQGGRSVSTGTMPDFAFNGTGVKIAAVSDDSPAAKAGIVKGDVIVAFDGKPVESLKDYSNYLKEHQPGDEVAVTIDRNGEKIEKKLILAER